MAVARELIASKRTRHGMFFAHLALEKALKAIVCRVTSDTPPKIHNLVRLSELACLRPTQFQLDVFADMNVFQIEGRYVEMLPSPPTHSEAQDYLANAGEVFRWLTSL